MTKRKQQTHNKQKNTIPEGKGTNTKKWPMFKTKTMPKNEREEKVPAQS
jgi:hypothetical protein